MDQATLHEPSRESPKQLHHPRKRTTLRCNAATLPVCRGSISPPAVQQRTTRDSGRTRPALNMPHEPWCRTRRMAHTPQKSRSISTRKTEVTPTCHRSKHEIMSFFHSQNLAPDGHTPPKPRISELWAQTGPFLRASNDRLWHAIHDEDPSQQKGAMRPGGAPFGGPQWGAAMVGHKGHQISRSREDSFRVGWLPAATTLNDTHPTPRAVQSGLTHRRCRRHRGRSMPTQTVRCRNPGKSAGRFAAAGRHNHRGRPG